MSFIAIIADIHGNRFALDAVIADIEHRGISDVVVAGDLVGRGPMGSEVIERIQSKNWPAVRGNHEDYLIACHHDRVDPRWRNTHTLDTTKWMTAELGADGIAYIESLPFELIRDGVSIYHGSPWSNAEGIGPWSADERVDETLAHRDTSMVAIAHTHRPHIWQRPDGLCVNVGSVGLPFNGDVRAQYAIIDTESQTAELIQVEYDRTPFLAYYESSGFLVAGGTTSYLLTLEIEHARPFLVPFSRWREKKEIDETIENVDRFVDIYDPTMKLADLLALLEDN